MSSNQQSVSYFVTDVGLVSHLQHPTQTTQGDVQPTTEAESNHNSAYHKREQELALARWAARKERKDAEKAAETEVSPLPLCVIQQAYFLAGEVGSSLWFVSLDRSKGGIVWAVFNDVNVEGM